MMCFLFSLIPATIFTAFGYFVLFVSSQSTGGIKKFGKLLAVWIFLIALFFPLMGAFVSFSGFCPMQALIAQMS